VAYHPKKNPISFAVASRDENSNEESLSRWDVINKEPQKVNQFILRNVSRTVDYMGFSTDGELLIGLDSECRLHYWDYNTGDHLFTHAPKESTCEKSKNAETK
jgi:hypothetical protein